MNKNPWDEPCKLVMSKFCGGKAQAPTCPSLLQNVVRKLFLRRTKEGENLHFEESEAIDAPEIFGLEVLQAAEWFGNSQGPGPDGIPN